MPAQAHTLETELLARCHWLLRVRWGVAATLVGLLVFSDAWLKLQRDTGPVWAVAAAMAAYNLACQAYARRRLDFCLIGEGHGLTRRMASFASAQMVLDILALTALLRYSGGIENPLALFYIFHMALAGTLLSRKASYALASLAVGLLGLVALGEMVGFVRPHYGFLSGVLEPPGLYRQPLFVGGYVATFACAMFGMTFIITSVAANLRERQAQLVETSKNLVEANARLEELERRKSQFMLVAAHQLKGPLSAIVNLLQVIGTGQTTPEKEKEMLGRAAARANGAIRQVQEMLQLARLRELSPDRQRWKVLDFREVVAGVHSAVAHLAENKRQRLEVEMPEQPVWVEGSGDDLYDAVMNLVDNAIKYTGDKGVIRVGLRDAGEGWELAVSDNGYGIPQADMTNLFQEFFRGSNVIRRTIEGTGLGLSIVRQIVQMHRGRVEVQSQENRGTTFTVWLPRAP